MVKGEENMEGPLLIAGKQFRSRLMVGTGKHRTNEEMVACIEASEAEIITVAIRRLNLDNPNNSPLRWTSLPIYMDITVPMNSVGVQVVPSCSSVHLMKILLRPVLAGVLPWKPSEIAASRTGSV